MNNQRLNLQQPESASAEQRDKLFISHAYPEDNEFARWLALQLAKEGYPIWCDLTSMLGGEVVWDDVKQTIREKAIKVLFVHSRHSNQKDGTLQEIHLAKAVVQNEGLEDFIIPLRIDDIPQDEITIELQRIAPIDFHRSWAEGLAQLLKKLDDAGVSRNDKFNPQSVSAWWRSQYSADYGIIEQPEDILSNWYPIISMPETLYLHSLWRTKIGKVEVAEALPYPAVRDGAIMISFAQAEDFEGRLGEEMTITDSKPKTLSELLEGENRREFKKHLSQILRLAWEQMVNACGLPQYALANNAKCGYFTAGLVEKDTLHFIGVDGGKSRRSVVGYKTVPGAVPKQSAKRYWHFGIQGKPMQYPALAYVIKPHVLFSSDGKEIWTSKDRLARARRNQCKNWWNDEWRDRITAVMSLLADEAPVIKIPLGSDVFLDVQRTPLTFESPVSYVSSGEEQRTRAEEEAMPDYEHEEEDADLLDNESEGSDNPRRSDGKAYQVA
ncbi:MAG: toll/interleukin-1 receptor domain-containing protein [Burkholderiales bacterium]